MTATLDGVPKKIKAEPSPMQRAAEMVRRAREQGPSMTGPGGQITTLMSLYAEQLEQLA